jgi:uncharacterized protein
MVTGLYAGIMALIYVGLSFNVILLRIKNKVSFGDNNIPALQRAVRIHGNFGEYIPFILLMMMIYEMQAGGNVLVLHITGGAMILGRILHGFGLFRNELNTRTIGTVVTQTLLIFMALLVIIAGAGKLSAVTKTPQPPSQTAAH